MSHFLLNTRTLVMLDESTVPVVRWRRHVRSSLHSDAPNSTGIQMFTIKVTVQYSLSTRTER